MPDGAAGGRTPITTRAMAFENFTWAAGIAAKTNYACVMSTVQVMTMHPLLAAKAMATIDHVSNGRFALNLVVGNAMENAMFGAPAIPRDEYYDYAEEWITVVKRLWSDPGAVRPRRQSTFSLQGRDVAAQADAESRIRR